MQVEQEHMVDASEPAAEGMYEYYYEYDDYRFVDGDLAIVARCHTDASHEVSFPRKEHNGKEEAHASVPRPTSKTTTSR